MLLMNGSHLFDQWTTKDWLINAACVICFPWLWIPLLAALIALEHVVTADKP